ncbi:MULTISPECIES: hypothetical protein [Bifidobacterium]|jgi:hypothetical protein|uniref:Uncharacterized protein n=3 Tax=Bifidobacterium TaxID=1678 RepID=A0A087DTJ8_9BIFI|nr:MULTISPECIES: hypothetical protein [Bifidobacterium]KAE8128697.1 hypothetical protein DDE84_04330 [Bifidobacterium tibiigranuli]KAE8128888.1 hypothetical protein DDF78_04120 [Bifidobacterium tibiigranuli]KFI98848.1 hypothetical protein BISU_2050 [Bifidobacterium subtile]MDY0170926.1 hypothetical protein [Thermoguttaceae bacterium]
MKGKTSSMMQPPSRKPSSVNEIFRDDSKEKKEEEKRVTVGFGVTLSTRKKLKQYALDHDTKMKDIAEDALLEYMENHQ